MNSSISFLYTYHSAIRSGLECIIHFPWLYCTLITASVSSSLIFWPYKHRFSVPFAAGIVRIASILFYIIFTHTHTNGTGASVGVTGLEVGAAGGRDNGRGDAVGLLDGWMVGMRDAVG